MDWGPYSGEVPKTHGDEASFPRALHRDGSVASAWDGVSDRRMGRATTVSLHVPHGATPSLPQQVPTALAKASSSRITKAATGPSKRRRLGVGTSRPREATETAQAYRASRGNPALPTRMGSSAVGSDASRLPARWRARGETFQELGAQVCFEDIATPSLHNIWVSEILACGCFSGNAAT